MPAASFADADASLAAAAKAFADVNNGVFAAKGTVRQIDMTRDGTADTAVDEGTFTCAAAASRHAGNSGSPIPIFANGTASSFLVQGFETERRAHGLIALLAMDGND